MLETQEEVLSWYESQPRAVTKEFVNSVPWHEVKNHPLDPAFIPVLFYMRDVESYTDVYYRELMRTPTGKNPVIRQFMDRWGAEEADHGDLLNRFLAEAGVPVEERWQEKAKAAIPFRYKVENYAAAHISRIFGRHFSGTHMVWGAINEMTTLQGYRRLWQAAKHPVLELVLRAVAREESAHTKFYWNIARLHLQESGFARKLARTVIEKLWTPVGQGTKPQSETDYAIATLFAGEQGVSFFHDNVSRRIGQLPGFANFQTTTARVANISLQGA